MEVLWRTDSALTVRQVSNGLPQSLAHTTVMTVLDRLAKKGFARRERDGRAWRYRPAATREAYVAELMMTALAQTGDRDAALARFAQSVSGAEQRCFVGPRRVDCSLLASASCVHLDSISSTTP